MELEPHLLIILAMLLEGRTLFLIVFAVSNSFALHCTKKCGKVWSKGTEIENSEFNNFLNNSKHHFSNKLTWKWRDNEGAGVWEAFFNEWPNKGTKSGGFYYRKPNKHKFPYLNWKIVNNTFLTWTSAYRKTPFEPWNLTLCESGVKIMFDPTKSGWTYNLGNIRLVGGESGKIFVEEHFFPDSPSKMKLLRRKRDEASAALDAEKLEDPTVWKRLKSYFKELFDQGPNDERGWMTRIADWLLGFLERILS